MNKNYNKLIELINVLPFFIGCLLLVVNLFNGCIFTVNDFNVYIRSWGIGGTIEMICCLYYPIYSIILVILRLNKDRSLKTIYLLLISTIPVISSIIQLLFYGLNFIWVGMALSLLLILVEIEIKEYNEIQREMTDQRIKIMLSQIQPHFLYNTLTTIACLCDEEPKKAKRAIISFSRYLRGNMDSLKQVNLVPFEKELKHVELYLSLEKMRFEEKLIIEYDIKVIDFYLPSLSIQPLVENAVKYGVGQKESGGIVTLRTYEDKHNYYIVVCDNGIGFDFCQKQNDGRTHIGLDNVENRLKEMCNGQLDIKSIKGVGTTISVIIPKGGL